MGAGLTGTCVALELADAGCGVDLYDREALSLSRASYNNEGKIHLGFVYGQDATGRTAETMTITIISASIKATPP
jgi:2-polyprenyl-6-methoxyphenol hydroxylase-like FAD-dependent oxidoreductase